MITDLIYVYCLSYHQLVLLESMDLENLEILVISNFHVIVKHVSSEEFSEEAFKRNLSDVEWLGRKIREHIETINALIVQNTIIPFKFGTIFKTEENLRDFITNYSDSLFENFHHIEEWSVRIFCNRKILSERIDELSEETAALEKQIMASSPGKAFLLKRKKSEFVENEMDRICRSYGQNCYDEFRKLCVSSSVKNLLPKEYSGREDTMILNAAFLVIKTKVNEFRNMIDAQKKKERDSGFYIEATGPCPPFCFINISRRHVMNNSSNTFSRLKDITILDFINRDLNTDLDLGTFGDLM
jgi:hypothetical protein